MTLEFVQNSSSTKFSTERDFRENVRTKKYTLIYHVKYMLCRSGSLGTLRWPDARDLKVRFRTLPPQPMFIALFLFVLFVCQCFLSFFLGDLLQKQKMLALKCISSSLTCSPLYRREKEHRNHFRPGTDGKIFQRITSEIADVIFERVLT